jgi:hypothetical protein
MRVESRELMAGYRQGLGGRNGLDRRATCSMDKAWCRMRLFMTGDKDMTGMGGLVTTSTRTVRLGMITTRVWRLRIGYD